MYLKFINKKAKVQVVFQIMKKESRLCHTEKEFKG